MLKDTAYTLKLIASHLASLYKALSLCNKLKNSGLKSRVFSTINRLRAIARKLQKTTLKAVFLSGLGVTQILASFGK